MNNRHINSPKRIQTCIDKLNTKEFTIKKLKKIIIITSFIIGYLFMRLCNSKNYQLF